MPGEALGRKVTRDPALGAARERLVAELAREIALVHGLRPGRDPDLDTALGAPAPDPALRALEELRRMIEGLSTPRPALELALSWLRDRRPQGEVVLCHGDFRVGNFLVGPDGLGCILDWEFAHWGAPEEDLAWICVRDWRFGVLDKPAGGIGSRTELARAYERASGRKVSGQALRWWEILGNARWAAGCSYQADRARSGARPELEYLAIGHRAVEMEFEAMRLIEKAQDG